MTEILCINFTYQSPNEDIDNCSGTNQDGTVNVAFTLTSLKNKLIENTAVLTKLLENVKYITDIIPIGYGMIEVIVSNPEVSKSLLENQVLVVFDPNKVLYLEEEDNEFVHNLVELDETVEETNNTRLLAIKNLVNNNENNILQDDSDNSTDTYSNSDEEVVFDETHKQSIIDKYSNLAETESSSDLSGLSDSSDTDSFE